MTIHPIEFQRHPVGANVAFFKHIDAQATFGAYRSGLAVQRAAVPEQHYIGNTIFHDDIGQEPGPFIHTPRKGDPVRQTPEQLVSAIEIYLVNFVSRLTERFSNFMKKRPHQPLKKQKATGIWRRVVLENIKHYISACSSLTCIPFHGEQPKAPIADCRPSFEITKRPMYIEKHRGKHMAMVCFISRSDFYSCNETARAMVF